MPVLLHDKRSEPRSLCQECDTHPHDCIVHWKTETEPIPTCAECFLRYAYDTCEVCRREWTPYFTAWCLDEDVYRDIVVACSRCTADILYEVFE